MTIKELIERLQDIERAFGSNTTVKARTIDGTKVINVSIYIDETSNNKQSIIITGY